GRGPEARLAQLLHPLAHLVAHRGRDRLLVELRGLPRGEASGIGRRAGPAVFRGELLRVPAGIARAREGPDGDVMGTDVVRVAVAPEVVVRRDDVRPIRSDEEDQPPGRL